MDVYGLTGGIASGKSTVHRMFADLGAELIDADAVYHALIAPQDGKPSALTLAIVDRFPGVLRGDGSLDRKKLGELVFSDAAARAELGRITHPAVATETGRRLEALGRRGVTRVLYDVPLLYERGLEGGMQGVIVVWVPYAVQVARLMQRDGLDEKGAKLRIAAQMPLDEKRDRATFVIDNSGTLEQTRSQIARVWQQIDVRARRKPR